jgi:hypothetical protein
VDRTLSDLAARPVICGIPELYRQAERGARHILSILDPGEPKPEEHGAGGG